MRRAKVLAVFGLGAVVFLGPAILGGKVLSQADTLYGFPPWATCRPPDLVRASNPLLGDQTQHFYPDRVFARRELRRGEAPLWNPFILTGTPFLGAMVSAVFSPFNVFSYVGDLKRSFAWSALARLIVAGTGMYWFCRLLAVSPVASLLAGIAFMLCGFQVVWLNHPQTNVSVLAPWTFAAVEKVVRRDRYAVPMLAVVVALLWLGGHPETVLHVGLGAGAFLLYRAGRPRVGEARAYGALLVEAGAGALLGVGIAAIALVPFAELL